MIMDHPDDQYDEIICGGDAFVSRVYLEEAERDDGYIYIGSTYCNDNVPQGVYEYFFKVRVFEENRFRDVGKLESISVLGFNRCYNFIDQHINSEYSYFLSILGEMSDDIIIDMREIVCSILSEYVVAVDITYFDYEREEVDITLYFQSIEDKALFKLKHL